MLLQIMLNETNRDGISNPQREVIETRDGRYRDSALLIEVEMKILNAVEISSQGTTWCICAKLEYAKVGS